MPSAHFSHVNWWCQLPGLGHQCVYVTLIGVIMVFGPSVRILFIRGSFCQAKFNMGDRVCTSFILSISKHSLSAHFISVLFRKERDRIAAFKLCVRYHKWAVIALEPLKCPGDGIVRMRRGLTATYYSVKTSLNKLIPNWTLKDCVRDSPRKTKVVERALRRKGTCKNHRGKKHMSHMNFGLFQMIRVQGHTTVEEGQANADHKWCFMPFWGWPLSCM